VLLTLLAPQSSASLGPIDVSQVYAGIPIVAAITVATTEALPSLSATADRLALASITVATTETLPALTFTSDTPSGAVDVQVSQAYTILPNAAALSSISVSQTEALPTLVSGVDTGATKSVQVSQAYAGVPDTALAALSITVSTTETMPTLSASMYDIIGQISGGGPISD